MSKTLLKVPLILLIAIFTIAAAIPAAYAADTFDQCANDDNPTPTGECSWISSILQSSNSAYSEGMSVPQRILLTDISSTPEGVHTITFEHDATKGGIHAYDFLTAWNQGNNPEITLNECDFRNPQAAAKGTLCNSLVGGPHILHVDVPNDPFNSKDGTTQDVINEYEAAFGNRQITIYADDEIVDGSLMLSHSVSDGGDTGDTDINYTLTWKSNATNVMIAFGGHIAVSGQGTAAWGPGLGASFISGGPYHFKLGKLDGDQLGSDDNQIKGADIQIVPNATLTVYKQVINDDGGSAVASNFTINVQGTNPSPSSFSGSSNGTVVELESGDYQVVETPAEGYNVSYSEGCSGSLAPGESANCTVTNDDILTTGTLTVIKQVVNDNGGTLQVSNFTLYIDNQTVTSNQSTSVSAGDHVVSEDAVAGYNGTIGGDCDAQGNVNVQPGDNKTCTITNDDEQAVLTVIKQVVNNNTGNLTADNFTLYIDETVVVNGEENLLDSGDYVVSEDAVENYVGMIGGDCDAQGNVNLQPGDNKTCIITNSDQAYCGDLIVNQESEQCDGNSGVGDHQTCDESCQLVNLTYCGDGIVQTPNDEGIGGPNNDGNESCDGQAGVGDNEACSQTCEIVDLTYCGDGIVQTPNDVGTGGPNNDGNESCDGQAGVGENQECTQTCEINQLPFCGDGEVNQEWEQCDSSAPEGYLCTDNCQLEQEVTCEDALAQGLIWGELDNGNGTVYNNASHPYTISLVAYEMYASLIEDQVLYDSETQVVQPGESATFNIDTPACAYQKELVCGEPLPFNPLYGDRVIEFDFENQDNFCTPTERDDNDTSVDVLVEEGFPQGPDFVFTCDVDGFNATNYYWYFGDGDIQPNSTNSQVFHTYEENGQYTVACTATDGDVWQTGTLGVEVDSYEPEVTVSVAEWYPQGNDYVFVCEADHFNPTSYDWDFGDGDVQWDMETDNVFHTYNENGDFLVSCTASEGDVQETGNLLVNVNYCFNYTVEITSAEPNPVHTGQNVTVMGTLNSEDADLSGETVLVNGQPVSVLLNNWVTDLTAPEVAGEMEITASFANSCEDQFSDSVNVTVQVNESNGSENESDNGSNGSDNDGNETEQNQTQSVSLLSNGGGDGGGDCSWGWHKEGDTCVKDTVPQPKASGSSGSSISELLYPEEEPVEDEEPSEEQPPEEETQEDLITGAAVGFGAGTMLWLLVALALVVLIGGLYYWRRS